MGRLVRPGNPAWHFHLILPPALLGWRPSQIRRRAMRGRLLLAVVAGTAVTLSGCGTILNLAGDDPDIYGGVQKDLAFTQTPRTSPLSGGCGKGGWGFVGLVL